MQGWLLGAPREKSRALPIFATLALLLVSFTSFAQGFDDRYIAAVGHFNQDGLQDIYVRQRPRIVPIPLDDMTIPIPLRPPVEPFVLQRRTDGGFDLIPSLTGAQRTSLASWAVSTAIRVLDTDLNVDGFKDLAIKGLAGVFGTYDQFVFANPSNGTQAFRLRQVDPLFASFIKDTYRWSDGTAYFENASIVNNWYRLVEGPPTLGWWYGSYLGLWGYEESDGTPMIAPTDDVFDSSQTPAVCSRRRCQFDFEAGIWQIWATIIPVTPVYDDFKQHFNAEAVDFGKQQHGSLQVLLDIISGQLQIEVGGGEHNVVLNDDNVSLEEAFYKDLLLRILLHDNYCAITLECSVTDITQVDMVVDRAGTGSYPSGQCTRKLGKAVSLNFTHGSYQVTSTDGLNLTGYTLERGGPDSATRAFESDVCTNKPKRIPQGTYSFTLTSGKHKKYPNVPSLETTAIQRTGILVHHSSGAAGSIGCILVSKTPGTTGTFRAEPYSSPKAASEAALDEIRKALTYQTSGVNRFLYSFGTVKVNNNGH